MSAVIKPGHGSVDDSEVENLIKGGALKDRTLKQRKRVADDFENYLQGTRHIGLAQALDGDLSSSSSC